MAGMTGATFALFVAATLFQLLGACLLPATRGMTAPLPGAAVFICYAIGIVCMARLSVSGVNLGVLIPIITLAIIIGSIIVGITVYGDNPSMAKAGLLTVAVLCMGLSFRF